MGRSREVGNEVLVLSDLNVEVRAVRRVAAVSERSGAKLQAAEVFGRSSTAASPAVPCILYPVSRVNMGETREYEDSR